MVFAEVFGQCRDFGTGNNANAGENLRKIIFSLETKLNVWDFLTCFISIEYTHSPPTRVPAGMEAFKPKHIEEKK